MLASPITRKANWAKSYSWKWKPWANTWQPGETFGTVEAVKTVSDLYLPVEADILERNEALEDHPELVNDDPYGQGWMVKIQVTDPAQADSLLSADDYQALIGA